MTETPVMERLIARGMLWISVILVAGFVALFFRQYGLPDYRAKLHRDSQRSSAIECLQNQLQTYYETHHTLPLTLAALFSGQMRWDMIGSNCTWGKSRQWPDYHRLKPAMAKLCLVYEVDTDLPAPDLTRDLSSGFLLEQHPAGRVCYQIELKLPPKAPAIEPSPQGPPRYELHTYLEAPGASHPAHKSAT